MPKDSENNKDITNTNSDNLPQKVESTEMMTIYGSHELELPKTKKVPESDIAKLDEDEGVNPAAAERANAKTRKSLYEVFTLGITIAFVAILIYFVFPWEHFFKTLVDRKPITITSAKKITDEDVIKMGGIDKLSPVQKAINEVTELRSKGKFYDARDKCEFYITNIHTKIECNIWHNLIYHYFEILYILNQHDDLLSYCEKVKEMNPDDIQVAYYPAKIEIKKIPFLKKYHKIDRKKYKQIIINRLNECLITEKVLIEMKSTLYTTNSLNGFRLLIADAYRKLWAINKFDWKDGNDKKAFEYLRKLPKTSEQMLTMKLEILKMCKNEWCHFWRNDPPVREIDGYTITEKILAEKIKRLKEQLRVK